MRLEWTKSNRGAFEPFLVTLYGSSLLVLILCSLLIPKGQDVLFINGNNTSLLDRFFAAITNLGNGLVFLPIVVGLLFSKFRYSVMATTAWVLHGVICSVLKRGVFPDLARPKALIDNSLLHFVDQVEVHSHFSFPSGHTATIFCATFLVSLLLQRRIVSVVLLTISLLIAYSRVYLLQHYLMDVAAGAVIGTLTAYGIRVLFSRIKSPSWMDAFIEIRVKPSLGSKTAT